MTLAPSSDTAVYRCSRRSTGRSPPTTAPSGGCAHRGRTGRVHEIVLDARQLSLLEWSCEGFARR